MSNNHRDLIETIEQAIAFFASGGMPALNLAERTRKDYRSNLRDLAAFLERRGTTKLPDVNQQTLESYQAEMDKRGYKASTRNRKTYAIKSFFNYLHRQGVAGERIVRRTVN